MAGQLAWSGPPQSLGAPQSLPYGGQIGRMPTVMANGQKPPDDQRPVSAPVVREQVEGAPKNLLTAGLSTGPILTNLGRAQAGDGEVLATAVGGDTSKTRRARAVSPSKSGYFSPTSRAALRNSSRRVSQHDRTRSAAHLGGQQPPTERVEEWRKSRAKMEALHTQFMREYEARAASHHTCKDLQRLIEEEKRKIDELQKKILSTQFRSSKLEETSAVIADAIVALQDRLPRVSLKSSKESAARADHIDKAILEYMDTHPEFTVTVKKHEPGVYTIGNRKMRLTTRGDMVVVRIGGGYHTLEEYFDGYWKSDWQAHQTIGGSLTAMSTSTWVAPSGSLSARLSGRACGYA
ncbi:hypothetical protein FOL47_008562 [Perkinsus chesapeaki]|uniref:GAR domain-containing protein n=1 Tax=Perkinsus chesapeaki TaxID=330153 RepID=A0A7J6LD42_PERCH|nr:hypothetical protein FOL47_008562 [Perkinsus chesapeaki]